MLSRLHDARVFTSSDDVVFSASTSRALLGDARRPSRVETSAAHGVLLEGEEDESKSDRDGDASSDGQDAPADDELEDEEEETKRTVRLKFPMQSPRHIAASQSYIHRQRRRGGALDDAATPAARRRHVKKLLDGDVDDSHENGVRYNERSGPRDGVVTLAKEHVPRQLHVEYHDHPMELVYLPTGEIRPRDECPPGLRLPATTDVRKLLEAPLSPAAKEKVRRRVKSTFEDSTASSTVHITRQTNDTAGGRSERWQRERPEVIQTNGSANKRDTSPTRAREMLQRPARNTPEDVESAESDDEANIDDVNARTTSRRTFTNVGRKGAQDGARSFDHSHPQSAVGREAARATRTGISTLHRDRGETASEDESVEGNRVKQPRNQKASANRNLELELQKEKKRVLEKMTLLLEEQGKTQALQHQLQISQDKVASMEKELERFARRGAANTLREDNGVRDRDDRIRALLEQVQSKDEIIRRLQSQIEQSEKFVTTHGRQDKSSTKYEDKIARLRQREAGIAKQLEDLMNRVTEFHSQVECWKVNSREALEGCDKRVDVLELMDRLWMDFPPFVASSDPPARKTSAEGDSSTIAFLTKKLRQKEEELRTTHVKYVELKELCARQCIREADLQNFINEHRLRGNLVIRKTNNGASARAATERETSNQHHRSVDQTNTMDEPPYGNQDTDSNDGDESDPGGDRIVQRPRVFIDIKRSNQQDGLHQEPSPIEHVRLAPSPALAQRYRQQQQEHQRHASTKQSNARTGIVQSGRTTRAATVASASRTLATTRQTLTTRTSTTQKRTGATGGVRASATGRSPSMASKNPSTRTSMASRRPSQAPLTSRPWV